MQVPDKDAVPEAHVITSYEKQMIKTMKISPIAESSHKDIQVTLLFYYTAM